jgi:isopentenyl-diphosphate delta-isomerase
VSNSVILVDDLDNKLGTMDKMQAHVLGRLHRAFSVFVFNSKGELLLQQRAFDKYHSGGKWTNTCCSHPAPGEKTIDAAHRRLHEEMGMSCELHYGFNFIYNAELANGITEYEYDHVYLGLSDDLPDPSPDEVASYKYMKTDALLEKLNDNPQDYSEWLKICFNSVIAAYKKLF